MEHPTKEYIKERRTCQVDCRYKRMRRSGRSLNKKGSGNCSDPLESRYAVCLELSHFAEVVQRLKMSIRQGRGHTRSSPPTGPMIRQEQTEK